MAKKAVTFQYMVKHKLVINVKGNSILFNEADQEITITGMSVSPALELTTVEAIAHYPDGAAKTIADAVSKILNTGAKAVAVKTEAEKKSNTIINVGDMKKPVNEAAGAAMPDMSIEVITDMLDVSTQVSAEGDSFKVQTKASDMSSFITFRQSKKIKIFINGAEFSPMNEVEFVKRVFPQIDMNVKYK